MKTWHRTTQKEIDFIILNWKTETYSEIASELNITTKAVSSLVHELKKKGIIDSNHWANRSTKNDLTGKRFDLVVAQKYLRTDKTGRAVWSCLCDCGQISELNTHNLKRNKSVSCGCAISKRSIERIINSAYKHHQANCTKRGMVSFLTLEEYFKISKDSCVYCGTFSKRKNPDTGDEIEMNSVDRINNEPYYKLENVQSTCFICQRMKSDMTHADFMNHMEKIKKAPVGQHPTEA